MTNNNRGLHLGRGLKDILATFLSRGGSLLVGLVMQSLMAWKLGPAGRGEYAICLIISSLVAVVISMGAEWGVNYYVSTKDFSLNQIITFSFIYCFFVTAIVLLLSASALFIFRYLDIPFTLQTWAYSIIWAIFMIFYSFYSSIFAGMREFNVLAKLTLNRVIMTLVLTFLFFQYSDLDYISPVLADIVSCFLLALLSCNVWIKKFEYRWEWPDFMVFSTILNYGLRSYIGSLGMITNTRIGTILLALYVDKIQLGYFSLSTSFLAQLMTISDLTARIIQPRITQSTDGRPDLVSMCIRVIGMTVLLIGGGLVLCAKLWVPIVFSKAFLPSIPIMMILVPGVWLRVMGKLLFPYFNGINQPEIVTKTTVITLLSNLVLLMVWIKPYGLAGAAWATTVSYGLSTAYTGLKFHQLTGRSIFSLILIKKEDFHAVRSQFQRNL